MVKSANMKLAIKATSQQTTAKISVMGLKVCLKIKSITYKEAKKYTTVKNHLSIHSFPPLPCKIQSIPLFSCICAFIMPFSKGNCKYWSNASECGVKGSLLPLLKENHLLPQNLQILFLFNKGKILYDSKALSTTIANSKR